MIPSLRVLKADVVWLLHVGPIKVRPVRFRKGLRNVSQVEVRAVPLTDRINAKQISKALILQRPAMALKVIERVWRFTKDHSGSRRALRRT